MGQMGNALASQVVDRQTLHHFEKHFISPQISRRHDIAIRQFDLARWAPPLTVDFGQAASICALQAPDRCISG
jgi:hypothetical protein